MPEVLILDSREDSNRKLTAVLYALYALGWFTFITAIAALIVNYIKLDEVRGTWLESHFRWQMRSFWFGMLWAGLLIAFVVVTLGVGAFVAWIPHGVLMVWLLYRIVRGWLNLNDGKPMYPAMPL
ncbi:DUF4870 family protein [Derxia gummosa]|uniref:DUF4870 family protein n=1 Tax=Derxia gummosa DSM 723 TaxID=1121388 RepID=A0A8B6X3T4_9BURK|nr:hypothetical protein [Derxia gummosa]